MNEIDCVECRLRRIVWLGVLVCLVVGFGLAILPFLPYGKGDYPDVHRNQMALYIWAIVWGLLTIILATCLTFYALRSYIIADKNGLRWRNMGKERSARWDEVTEFYNLSISSTQTYGRIETTSGQVKFGDYDNQEALRAIVQNRATNAASREWKKKNASPKIKTWPQEFGYNVFWNSVLRLLMLAFLLGLLGSWIWQMWATLSVEPMSFQLRVLGAVVVLLIGSLPALLFVAHFVMWKSVRQRCGERVIATLENITFIDKARRIEARWDDVSDYYIERSGNFSGSRYIIETAHGNGSFSNDIGRVALLKQIVIEYSINAKSNEWELEIDADQISEKNTHWEEQQKADGRNIYHFRSNVNRAMLWFFWSLGLSPIFHLLLAQYSENPARTNPLWIALVFGASFASWMTYLYKHNFIATDEHGIYHRTPFGEKFIAWNDVEYFGKSDWDFSYVVGKNTRIRFYSVAVRQQQLLAEIAKSSTRSRTREWHHI